MTTADKINTVVNLPQQEHLSEQQNNAPDQLSEIVLTKIPENSNKLLVYAQQKNRRIPEQDKQLKGRKITKMYVFTVRITTTFYHLQYYLPGSVIIKK